MAKILITGGTGLVGTRLSKVLTDNNHEVIILSRKPKEKNEYKWDIDNNYIDKNAFKDVEFIIHLAGAGIAEKRWTNDRKKIIIDSRVDTANLLYTKVKELNIALKSFISASGIGYYGAVTTDTIFKESDKAGNDFLGEVCTKWENAALQFKSLNVNVAILRTGIVLSENGGALEKMKTPIISPLGTGKQYMPWIHIDDLCNMYMHMIEKNEQGIFNAVAPKHHTNKSFSKLLAKAVKRPYVGVGVPRFLLKIIFGDMSKILLEGSRISSKKIEKNNFSFRFNKLIDALNNVS